MVTDNYINQNKTETFKKGDKVIMYSCHEATFEEYKDKVWICQTSSFLDKAKQEVVFLEDFSGCFLSKFLQIKSSLKMKWKPKFFIVYPDKMIHQIKWTDNWGCHSVSNLPEMLREILNVSTIGGEMKLIWNNNHRWQVIQQNNISSQELDDYLKADCSMLSFSAKGTKNKTYKLLIELGANNIICADNYRDMMLQQAYYKNNKKFLL